MIIVITRDEKEPGHELCDDEFRSDGARETFDSLNILILRKRFIFSVWFFRPFPSTSNDEEKERNRGMDRIRNSITFSFHFILLQRHTQKAKQTWEWEL